MQRGQAWGVMEVLIGVIIMGMSMAIVFYALRSIEDTRCVASIKSNTVQLENAMLDVALGSPPTTRRVVFSMPECGDKSVEALRFVYYKDRKYCGLCPGQYNGCWIIEPTLYDYKQKKFYTLVDASVCVNMPAAIGLDPVTGATDPKCLGAQISRTPCPMQTPDAPVGSNNLCSSCAFDTSNVPPSLFTQSGSCTASQPSGEKSVWATFGRQRNQPRAFMFELSKSVIAGSDGIIRICPTTQLR